MAMDVNRLLKPELLALSEELGVDVSASMNKPQIVDALEREDFESELIASAWQSIQTSKLQEKQLKEVETEKVRLETELRKTSGKPSRAENRGLCNMSRLMQTFKLGQDMRLYFFKFERACENARFWNESCPRRVLRLLPCETADVTARLSVDDSDNYEKVNGSLLNRFRLSPDAFRQNIS